jgi:hypothetical protein
MPSWLRNNEVNCSMIILHPAFIDMQIMRLYEYLFACNKNESSESSQVPYHLCDGQRHHMIIYCRLQVMSSLLRHCPTMASSSLTHRRMRALSWISLFVIFNILWLLAQNNNTAIQQEQRHHRNEEDTPGIHSRTYGTQEYEMAKIRILREANRTGWFDSLRAQRSEDLPEWFQERHRQVLNQRRVGADIGSRNCPCSKWRWKV